MPNHAGRAPSAYTTVTVAIPPHTDQGPKMRQCTEMERVFIYAMVECGGDATQAAFAAGYGKKSDTREQQINACRQAGYNLLRRERVLDAMQEEAKKRLYSMGMIAANNLAALLNDPGLSAKDRFRANVEALDRAGLVVQQKVEVTHKDEKDANVVAEIRKLASDLGLDPSRLLGQAKGSNVVDAEFTVVRSPTEGLEDIL